MRILTVLILVLSVLIHAQNPTITLNGSATVSVNYGDYFREQGASAQDDTDGDISDNIVIQNDIDLKTLGSYTVTYSVTNSNQLTTTITRTVNVVDEISPNFLLSGEDDAYIYPANLNFSFDYKALDNYDGDITSQVTYHIGHTTGEQAPQNPGDVRVDTLKVTDSNGNFAQKLLNLELRENPAPDIVLSGDQDYNLAVGETFVDPGYTAIDILDGNISANVVVDNSSLNTNIEGEYPITYTVTNSSGVSYTRTRFVNVYTGTLNFTLWKLSDTESENILYTYSNYDDALNRKKFDAVLDSLHLERDSTLKTASDYYVNNYKQAEIEWAIGDINNPEQLSFREDFTEAMDFVHHRAKGLTADDVRLVMKIVNAKILVEFDIHNWAAGGASVSYSRGTGPGDIGVSESPIIHDAEVWKIEPNSSVDFRNYTFDGDLKTEADRIFDELWLQREQENGLFNAIQHRSYNDDDHDGLFWLMVADSWSFDDLKYISIDMFMDEFKYPTNENMRDLAKGFKYLMYYKPKNTIIEIDFDDWSSDGYAYRRGTSDTDLGGSLEALPPPNFVSMDNVKQFTLGNDSDITIDVNGEDRGTHHYSDRLTYLSALSFESDDPFNSGLEYEEGYEINLMWYIGSMPTSVNVFKDADDMPEFDELGGNITVTFYLPSEKIAFELKLERYNHSNSYRYVRPVVQETLAVGPNALGFNSEDTNYALLVGNGTEDTASNALALDYTGNMTISGDLNINSDKNLKNNIKSLGSTLNLLTKIDGKTYNFKKDASNQTKIGLIAQEVEKFFPELVSEQDGVKSVNYIGLVPVLINAIKEQQAQINNLVEAVNE